MESDYSKISLTAMICARLRGDCTDIPFAKEIIDEIDRLNKDGTTIFDKRKLEIIYRSLGLLAKIVPSAMIMSSVFEARYKTINKTVSDLKDYVNIELASGLSPRSLELEDRTYIDTDLPGMIRLKGEIIRKIKPGLSGIQHEYLAVDPLNNSDMKFLMSAYQALGDHRPVAIINEGFMMYFDKDEQRCFRDNVREFLEKSPNHSLWITSDLVTKNYSDGVSKIIKGVHDAAKGAIVKLTGRKFTLFESEDAIRDFLGEGGLTVEFYKDAPIDEISSFERMHLDPSDFNSNLRRSCRAHAIGLA